MWLATPPCASTSGTRLKHADWPTSTATPAAGHSVPPYASTANWDRLPRHVKIAHGESSTVCLVVPYRVWGVWMGSTTACKLSNWHAEREE